MGVLLHIMQFRSKDESANITMAQVNHDLLDKLVEAVATDEKLAVMNRHLPRLNKLELKWLTRIILKDLKLGIGHESILKHYH